MFLRKIHILFITVLLLPGLSAHGWYEKTHAYITKVAIELVKRVDSRNNLIKYEELYLPDFVLELGRGGWREDFNPPVEGNERAFRHFYDPDKTGPEKGAKFYYHFYVWIPAENAAVTYPSGGYYENILEWAHNGALIPSNPFHWLNAIEAYDYTLSSRKEAYYRLGHVCHLLEDMSEPDHATGTPHPGSGKIIPDTLEDMFGKPILNRIDRLNISQFSREALKAVVSMMYLKLINLIEKDMRIIGLEGLIEDNISFSWVEEFFWGSEKTQVKADRTRLGKPPIDGRLIKKFQNFNDYFNKLARKSKADQKASGLPLAIGCADIGPYVAEMTRKATSVISYYEPIYAIPTINVNNKQQSGQFFNLAWPLIKEATEYTAGLMEHFFDIVNPPPYVREVTVSQGGEERYRAMWRDGTHALETGRTREKMYEADYTQFPRFYDTVPSRGFTLEKRDSVDADEPATITIHFGPEEKELIEHMDPDSISVLVGGVEVRGTLPEANIWEGQFTPRLSPDLNQMECPIEIKAKDTHNHFPRQDLPESGYELDSDPSSVAKCESSRGYPWKQGTYEPGPDKHHSIYVTKEEEQKVEQELSAGGECPIPKGAKLLDFGASKSYRIGIMHVGPSLSWYDDARTKLKAKKCYDEDGRPIGIHTEYFENGGIKEKGTYVEGFRNGLFTYYYENGNPRTIYTYNHGETTGPYTRYHKNGKIASTGDFLKGKKHKDWQEYTSEGKLIRITPYIEGTTHGTIRGFYIGNDTAYSKGGGLSWETEYKNGSRTGSYRSWYNTGELSDVGQFTEFAKDGPWKKYYRNGNLQNEITYSKTKFVGRAKFYNENGELTLVQVYSQEGEHIQNLDKDGKVTWDRDKDKKKGN
ncbi:MAG: hypothetical protein MUP70_04675 [Candidatus Aminicenantes bacterium]|nr:hypothetical protein [Candidatus Aminicenantes bacterium]